MRWWHYLIFLLTLATISRVLMDKGSPGLVGNGFRFVGNLFNSTIEG